jgi:drug/metabolite transporter (DMT)-like permease
MPALVPIVIVVVSGILYHLAQKTSAAASPWPMLAVAYGAALGLSLVLALASGDGRRAALGRAECSAGLLLGLAAFGIEAGFFFVYRAGWKLASVSVIANASVTAVLALVGVAVFREPFTAVRAAGLLLATGGAALIARGG